jgi:tungstate transport system permease protein
MIDSLLDITSLSLRVTGSALFFSSLIGIPVGAFLGLRRFPGRRLAIALVYTGMGLPPVVVGLVVYLLLSRSGPLVGLQLPFLPALFTPAAMVIAQVFIATPLVAGFTMSSVLALDPQLRLQLQSLGASEAQVAMSMLSEARLGVIVALVAGFGGIISEVGAVMMVGGNIEHRTRVLTTAIVLETQKGNFELAMMLGALLLSLAFLANVLLLRLQGRSLNP